MGKIKVDTVTNLAGSGAPNIPDGVTIDGVALASVNKQEHYAQSAEPSSPANGAVWYDTDDDKAYVYVNSEFYELTYTNMTKNSGSRGVFGGGEGSVLDTMDYITIATTGNATDFGNLSVARRYLSGCSNNSRGVFAGGADASTTVYDTIDYITVSTPGNATDFGNLTQTTKQPAASSNGVRGVFGGGITSNASGITNKIDYITIATTGNASDFGDLSAARQSLAGGGNLTRALFAGGYTGSARVDTIDYITVSTTGNATDFGNLTVAKNSVGAVANSTRFLTAGGYATSSTNVIEYVTIANTGNGTDFGDLTITPCATTGGVTNETRGVFGAYADSGTGCAKSNIMDYITIASAGNATDFGDLTVARYNAGCLSGA